MYLNQFYFWVYPSGLVLVSTFFYLCHIYEDVLSNFYRQSNFTKFDFIVVGAGTAGITVATRLAEDPSNEVLLLEAGDKANFLLDIPFLIPLLQSSRYDWQYSTEPQKHACFGLLNNSSKWPRGKVVGGSSRLNYAVYIRGQKQDFDSWSNQGNIGWDYAKVLSYLKKSENQKGRFKDDEVYHSVKGELSVDDPSWITPMADAILSAAAELGINSVDVNARENSGFMLVQANLENGKRCSSDSAFLKRATKRENLKVISNAHVEKVLFKEGHLASAVVYEIRGTKYVAEANKEIILSAGAIETPKILMLSGIGPKDHLKSFKIPILIDLPVGKNLQDHLTTGTDLILLNEQIVSLGAFASPLAAFNYIFNGSGPWTSIGIETVGFLHSSHVDLKTETPNIQMMSFPFGLTFDGGSHLKKISGISEKVWAEYFQPLVGKPTATISPVLLQPKSRGEILLRSTDPIDPPRINPQYLSHPDDVKILVEGLQIVEKLLKTESMKKFGAKINDKVFPGCEAYDFGSVSYWECYVRHLTLTSYHPVGTCKMGPGDDHSAVVDPQLRVHGVRNLRVVDASIMPTIVSGNTNAATVMIGEKGVDMIKTYWDDLKGVCDIENKDSCPDK